MTLQEIKSFGVYKEADIAIRQSGSGFSVEFGPYPLLDKSNRFIIAGPLYDHIGFRKSRQEADSLAAWAREHPMDWIDTTFWN